jgi:hypothetical protein
MCIVDASTSGTTHIKPKHVDKGNYNPGLGPLVTNAFWIVCAGNIFSRRHMNYSGQPMRSNDIQQ